MQVKGSIHLEMPDVEIDEESIKEVSDDFEQVSEIEKAVDEWCKQISTIIEQVGCSWLTTLTYSVTPLISRRHLYIQEGQKTQEGRGPLAEIEFWRARNTALSGIYEQISMPHAQLLIQVLQKAETPNLPVFTYQFAELSKLHAEAKDNVKFLTTLERHFKNITSGSFSTILDTLPSLMNAIRMVWIISRHYNSDDRMVSLVQSPRSGKSQCLYLIHPSLLLLDLLYVGTLDGTYRMEDCR